MRATPQPVEAHKRRAFFAKQVATPAPRTNGQSTLKENLMLFRQLGTCASIVALSLIGCSAGNKPEAMAPQPAAGPADARPVAAAPYGATNVHVDELIMKACNLPTPRFDFDSAKVEPGSGLHALAECFTTGPMKGHAMKLIGHADPRGGTEYNLALGQRRAGGVEMFLVDHGMAESKIATSSRGDFDAIGTNEAGWAADRHVDIMLGD